MKIYQIIKATGCYEDYHEYVQATYLSKERAENELARLKASVLIVMSVRIAVSIRINPLRPIVLIISRTTLPSANTTKKTMRTTRTYTLVKTAWILTTRPHIK